MDQIPNATFLDSNDTTAVSISNSMHFPTTIRLPNAGTIFASQSYESSPSVVARQHAPHSTDTSSHEIILWSWYQYNKVHTFYCGIPVLSSITTQTLLFQSPLLATTSHKHVDNGHFVKIRRSKLETSAVEGIMARLVKAKFDI